MKKRLRKKLHKGEFQEMGFEVEFDYPENFGQEQQLDLLCKFIEEAIEANGLEIGGSFVHRFRGSVSENQRELVIKWLEANPDISNIKVGELRDAWYGWDD